MTKDEILSMSAGEEMDALIADIVGWNRNHKIDECEDGFYDYCVYCGYEPRFNEVEPGTCDGFPNYSNDIAAAWEVLERTRRNGWGAIISNKYSHNPSRPLEYGVDLRKDGNVVIGYGETAPLAICRTALLLAIEDK